MELFEGFRSRSLYELRYILSQKDLTQSKAACRASLLLQTQALTLMARDHPLREQVHVIYPPNDIMIGGSAVFASGKRDDERGEFARLIQHFYSLQSLNCRSAIPHGASRFVALAIHTGRQGSAFAMIEVLDDVPRGCRVWWAKGLDSW